MIEIFKNFLKIIWLDMDQLMFTFDSLDSNNLINLVKIFHVNSLMVKASRYVDIFNISTVDKHNIRI